MYVNWSDNSTRIVWRHSRYHLEQWCLQKLLKAGNSNDLHNIRKSTFRSLDKCVCLKEKRDALHRKCPIVIFWEHALFIESVTRLTTSVNVSTQAHAADKIHKINFEVCIIHRAKGKVLYCVNLSQLSKICSNCSRNIVIS